MINDPRGEPVRIMHDGMNEKPIAIPFPFKIGIFTIENPDDWHAFRRHYKGLETQVSDLEELVSRLDSGEKI